MKNDRRKLYKHNQKLMARRQKIKKQQVAVKTVLDGAKMPLWLRVKLYFMEVE